MFSPRRTCLPATHENMPHTTQQCTTTLNVRSARGSCPRRPDGRLGPLSARWSPRRCGGRGAKSIAWASIGHADPELAESAPIFTGCGLAKLRRGHPLLPSPRRDGRHDGGQNFQGRCSFSVGVAAAPARPADDPHVSAPFLDATRRTARTTRCWGRLSRSSPARAFASPRPTDYAPELLVEQGPT